MILPHNNHKKQGFHLDDTLYNNIKELPKRIEKDKDVVFLVCGDPGNGKSTMTSQILYTIITNTGS